MLIIKVKEIDLFTTDCCSTDDSILTLALGKAIMDDKKTKNMSLERIAFDTIDYEKLEKLAVRYIQNRSEVSVLWLWEPLYEKGQIFIKIKQTKVISCRMNNAFILNLIMNFYTPLHLYMYEQIIKYNCNTCECVLF